MLCTQEQFNELILEIKNIKDESLDTYLEILFLLKNCSGTTLDICDIAERETMLTSLFNNHPDEQYGHTIIKTRDHGTYLLDWEEHYNGYCECSENDEGYIPKYQCCGDGRCDYSEPFLIEEKTGIEIKVSNFIPKMFWEFKDSIIDTGKKIKQEEIDRLKEEIEQLNKQLELKQKELGDMYEF